MSHTFVNYPSDTNRMTKLVMPTGDLNGSAAALNASIQALTDAIAAAQAVLATLVPYTGATENVDLGSHSISAGSASINSGTITLNNDGSASFATTAMSIDDTGAASLDDGAIQLGANQTGYGPGSAAFANSTGNQLALFDQYGGLYLDNYTILLGGSAVGSWFDAGNGQASFANGAITLGTGPNLGTGSYIETDGSALFASGAIIIDSSGNLTAHALNIADVPSGSTEPGGLSVGDTWACTSTAAQTISGSTSGILCIKTS